MAEIIQLTNVRLSFPQLVTPTLPKGVTGAATKKYSADFIFPANHPDMPRFMAAVQAVATEKWKEQAQGRLQAMQVDRRMRCWGDGSEKINQTTLKQYDGYADSRYVSASASEEKPVQMVRPDGTLCDNTNTMERQQLARKLYGGCYVNVAVKPWPQDNQFGKAVRCELIAVQFSKDGDPFGDGGDDVSGMFGAVAAPAAAPASTGFSWA